MPRRRTAPTNKDVGCAVLHHTGFVQRRGRRGSRFHARREEDAEVASRRSSTWRIGQQCNEYDAKNSLVAAVVSTAAQQGKEGESHVGVGSKRSSERSIACARFYFQWCPGCYDRLHLVGGRDAKLVTDSGGGLSVRPTTSAQIYPSAIF
ncbi:unnamed protein product [Ectocarpus sp. 13 AM-2016]